MADRLKVYAIYGKGQTNEASKSLCDYSVGHTEEEAVENAINLNPRLRLLHDLNATQIAVRGFRISAESLEQEARNNFHAAVHRGRGTWY
ncbi:hypothetical protein J4461_04110 [Candidatus Pacearchaeota archaeon]|nr:hypothetical protein [Candidatus Pacearchaeota archaeon]